MAGLLGNWTTEGTQQLHQKLTWRAETLKLNKIFIYSDATSELIEDGMNIAQQLAGAMSAAAAYSLDAAILNGSGIKQPVGLLNHASAIKVSKDRGQLHGTVTYSNLVNMYSHVAPKCQKNGVWFISSDVMPQLLSMTFPGSTNPVLVAQLTAGGADPVTQTIFGKPIVVTEIAQPLGHPRDITFADMCEYAIAMKSTARVEQTNAFAFDSDIQSWRLILRVTGQPLWSQPITPSGGGNTLSWATYLRAAVTARRPDVRAPGRTRITRRVPQRFSKPREPAAAPPFAAWPAHCFLLKRSPTHHVEQLNGGADAAQRRIAAAACRAARTLGNAQSSCGRHPGRRRRAIPQLHSRRSKRDHA